MIKTQQRCGWLSFFSSCESGGRLIQLSPPSPVMANSATHLRVGGLSWSEFDEWKNKSEPSNFYSCESHPKPLNFTIAWFSTSKESWECPFFSSALWAKVPLSLGLIQVLHWDWMKTWNQALGILLGEKKKVSLPVELSVELAYFRQHLGDKTLSH